jgi:hypothetical protein
LVSGQVTVLSAGAAAYAGAFSRTRGSDKPKPKSTVSGGSESREVTRFGRRPAPSDIDRQDATHPHVALSIQVM